MHVHQMGDELCIGCKARVIADVTAKGDCLQAKNTQMTKENKFMNYKLLPLKNTSKYSSATSSSCHA